MIGRLMNCPPAEDNPSALLCSPAMATESISEQQKPEENNVVVEKEDLDWISTLPHSILLHILSFLPTETSVATMPLVSRTWRYLWKDLQVFYFYNRSSVETDCKRFVNFFKAVLTLRRYRDIRKMRFDYYHHSFNFKCPTDSIKMCFRDAMGPRLEELHLNIKHDYSVGMNIPSTLFDCTNLVSLRLNGSIHLDMIGLSTPVHFPSLRNLYLKIDYLDSVDAFILGCPILETLSITDRHDGSSFRVPHSLKRLEYHDDDHDFITYIEIDAPHLEYLSITIHGTFKGAIGNLRNVEEAHIDVSFVMSESDSQSESEERETVDPVLSFLRALSGTKHLTLSRSSTMRLLRASVLDFPELCYLLHLKLELPCFNSIFLIDVLEKCHLLQDLIIQSYWGQMPVQTWEPQSTRIPNCLVSHLTSIQIKGYRGLADELTFAGYILRNALVLKTMIIKSDIALNIEKKHRILKKLSKMPRGSVMCQLEFD